MMEMDFFLKYSFLYGIVNIYLPIQQRKKLMKDIHS
jgi:hypothetical protein